MNREQIIQMAREAGFERLGHTDEDWVCYPEDIEAFAKLVAEHEREACAKMCEEYAIGLERNYSEIIADKIRARGQAIEQPKVRTGNCLRVGVCASEGHKIAPPLQPLTDEELKPICDEYRILFGGWVHDFAQAIEAKLKEKNT